MRVKWQIGGAQLATLSHSTLLMLVGAMLVGAML
jgi:hypothetical protein